MMGLWSQKWSIWAKQHPRKTTSTKKSHEEPYSKRREPLSSKLQRSVDTHGAEMGMFLLTSWMSTKSTRSWTFVSATSEEIWGSRRLVCNWASIWHRSVSPLLHRTRRIESLTCSNLCHCWFEPNKFGWDYPWYQTLHRESSRCFTPRCLAAPAPPSWEFQDLCPLRPLHHFGFIQVPCIFVCLHVLHAQSHLQMEDSHRAARRKSPQPLHSWSKGQSAVPSFKHQSSIRRLGGRRLSAIGRIQTNCARWSHDVTCITSINAAGKNQLKQFENQLNSRLT